MNGVFDVNRGSDLSFSFNVKDEAGGDLDLSGSALFTVGINAAVGDTLTILSVEIWATTGGVA